MLRLRSPAEFRNIIHNHYDDYEHENSGKITLFGPLGLVWLVLKRVFFKHTIRISVKIFGTNTIKVHTFSHKLAGLPIHILMADFWVPSCNSRRENSKFAGVDQFQEILVTTKESCILFAKRVTQDQGVIQNSGIFFWNLSMNHIEI